MWVDIPNGLKFRVRFWLSYGMPARVIEKTDRGKGGSCVKRHREKPRIKESASILSFTSRGLSPHKLVILFDKRTKVKGFRGLFEGCGDYIGLMSVGIKGTRNYGDATACHYELYYYVLLGCIALEPVGAA
jgi:hypothetical protein